MNTLTTPSLSSDAVDFENAIIRGVSVVTKGPARGHNLEVDTITLNQMRTAAAKLGQVPVKIDHKSGAGAVCGFLDRFRIEGNKLKADWHLLESHPQTPQILEIAQRMPKGVGLSAAFVATDDAEVGFARCKELISVDFVGSPAANPTGLFARPERPDGLERAGRVLDSGKTAAEVAGIAAGAGFVARRLMKSKRLPRISSPSFKRGLASAVGKGAIIGGVAGGLYRIHKDKVEARRFQRSDLIRQILFAEKPAIRRVTDATADEIRETELPGADIVQAAKNHRIRKILWRGSKIAAGGLAGHLVGKRLGGKAGVIAGGIAGALLSRPSHKIIFMNSNHHREITRLVDQAAQPIRQGRSESHDLKSLSRRLFTTPEQAARLVDEGVLESLGPIHRDRQDGPLGFKSDDLNDVQRSILAAVAEQVLEASDGADLNSLRLTIAQALKEHKEGTSKPAAKTEAKPKEFSRPDEDRPGPGLLKTAAIGAGAYGIASAVRGARPGSSLVDAIRRGNRANVGDLRRAAGVIRPSLSAATKKVLKVAGYRPI